MTASLKQMLHLLKLNKSKIGKPSPLKGRKTKPFTEEHINNLCNSQKKRYESCNGTFLGKKHSIESRIKMSKSAKIKIFSEQQRENMSLAQINRWKDIKKTTQIARSGKAVKQWKRLVLERDNYTCQDCLGKGKYSELEAHHIAPWSLYPELRFIVENGITYCYKCHKKNDKYRR